MSTEVDIHHHLYIIIISNILSSSRKLEEILISFHFFSSFHFISHHLLSLNIFICYQIVTIDKNILMLYSIQFLLIVILCYQIVINK